MLAMNNTLCVEMTGHACTIAQNLCGLSEDLGRMPHPYCTEIAKFCETGDHAFEADAKVCMTLKKNENACTYAESLCSAPNMKATSFCLRQQDICGWK